MTSISKVEENKRLIPGYAFICAFLTSFFYPLCMSACMHLPSASVGTYAMCINAMNNTLYLVAVSCSVWSDCYVWLQSAVLRGQIHRYATDDLSVMGLKPPLSILSSNVFFFFKWKLSCSDEKKDLRGLSSELCGKQSES